MVVRTVPVTAFQQNARILIDPASGSAVIVDPGGDVAELLDAVDAGVEGAPKLEVSCVALTHAHLDHAGGVAELLEALERRQGKRPELVGHRADEPLRKSIARQAMMFGLPPSEFNDCPEPDRYLEQGDSLAVGEFRGEVRFTPGHAPGHISFYFPAGAHAVELFARGRSLSSDSVSQPLLIAGDTLFAGSIGRTDLPGGNHAQLIRSIEEQIFTLPGETIVMPGHGEDTTVQRERCSNPYFAGCA